MCFNVKFRTMSFLVFSLLLQSLLYRHRRCATGWESSCWHKETATDQLIKQGEGRAGAAAAPKGGIVGAAAERAKEEGQVC